MNSYREAYSGCKYARHAEMDALINLRCHGSKRRKWINLVVIRLNREGKLCASKPCSKCIYHLTHMKQKYKIRYVYYSTDDHKIVRVRFSKLVDEDPHFTRRFR